MKVLQSLFIICILFITVSCTPKLSRSITGHETWVNLWNGENLNGWDTYLGMPYWQGQDIWNQKLLPNYRPYGLNYDPEGVFTVVTEDGAPALRLSGEVYGGISTKEEYGNYHLQLEFKWGDEKFGPRKDLVMDSGILYHGQGQQGTEAGFWLRSQEFQIQEHNCGDYWGIAGAQMGIRTVLMTDEKYHYDPKGQLQTFGDGSRLSRNVKKYPDNEHPTGHWNTVDLYCFGDKSIHVVNGIVTMILENSSLTVDGVKNTLNRGKIQIQAEGAEVFYRNIRLTPIQALPRFIGGTTL